MKLKKCLVNANDTPLDIYIQKLEDTIMQYCKINQEDYFDIRDLTKFKNKNILDSIKLYYKLNSIVKIVVRNINKIKPAEDFFNRNKLLFIKRKAIQENLHKMFDFKLRYKDIYLIYDGFYTLIEEVSDYYRVKIFIENKIQIKFYFNKNGMYIVCPKMKNCKHCKVKKINNTSTCYKKTRSSLRKCYDIKFERIIEPVFPSKLCISELYTIYNLNNLFQPIIKTKDFPDRINDYTNNNLKTEGVYISRYVIKYLNPIKRENKEKKTLKPHTRVGHWRFYKKINRRVWIDKIQVNQKSDIKKINKTPYFV